MTAPSRASSSRIGAPPISNMTRPVDTLEAVAMSKREARYRPTYRVAQNSNVPFPFPIRVSFPLGFVSEIATLYVKK